MESCTPDPADPSAENTVQTFSSSLASPGPSVQKPFSPLMNEQQPSAQTRASPVGPLSSVSATTQETRTEITQFPSMDDCDHGVNSTSLSSPVNVSESASQTPAQSVVIAYEDIVHWRKKFFEIPNNSAGKAFINELAGLLQTFVESGGTEKTALYSFMVLPALLLQKPADKCTYKNATQHLRRRLDLWEKKDLEALLDEGKCIQHQLRFGRQGGRWFGEEDAARSFGNRVSAGRVHQALRMLSEKGNDPATGVLSLDEVITLKSGRTACVKELLEEKHPRGEAAHTSILIEGDYPSVNEICFERLTPALMQRIAQQCQGSAGPSGLDSDAWRRMCSSFKGASSNMCQALATFARLLATQNLESDSLVPFLSCRLIALDKRPGVRPIGVCELLRRITAKAVLKVVGPDVEEACGFVQKCSGSPAGLEAAVHAMQRMFDDKTTEGILFVDAKNAFNSLNRKAALHNVKHLCPALSTSLSNCYKSPSRLFVAGGGEITSNEGTTQGDPFSMPFYALATLPLIELLQEKHSSVRQTWLADDSSGAGKLLDLRRWWQTLSEIGKRYGYFTNSEKTTLLVQAEMRATAEELFMNTGVQIATKGVCYLGSAVGEENFMSSFIEQKVDEWLEELQVLASFAKTEPHAAFAALTHGLRSRYVFLMRTLPSTSDVVRRIDQYLEDDFLPAMSNHKRFSADLLALLRLPARLGGIGLPCLSQSANFEHNASIAMTESQVSELINQNCPHQTVSVQEMHRSATIARSSYTKVKKREEIKKFKELASTSSLEGRRLELLAAKGASSWLTTLPLKAHGFWLSRRDFQDALALRYDWKLEDVPIACVCGAPFVPDHAIVCPFGGYPTIRHNEVRDFIGGLLADVCHNVAIEPLLVPLQGEVFRQKSTNTGKEARLDIRARGFWTRQEDAFFDVRVFHPNASSYTATSLEDLFHRHERQKQLEYEERITNVDHGSFCPLVFTTTGAVGPLCDRFLKRLAAFLGDTDLSYATTMAWIRCKLSFALLRNTIMCIRGTRSSRRKPVESAERDVCIAESRLPV